MKKTLMVLVTSALLSFSCIATASADTPNSVSLREFVKVEKNWSKSRIQGVFDVSGKATFRNTTKDGVKQLSKVYPGARKSVYAVVYYEKGPGKTVYRAKNKWWCDDTGCATGW